MPSSFQKNTESAFKQQRSPNKFHLYFVIGAILILIRIYLHVSNSVKEFVYDYTDCISQENPSFSCAEILEMDTTKACTCVIPLQLTEAFEGDVDIFYGLSNFYQNHHQYVKSRDDQQLLGALGPVSNTCEPFARYPDQNNMGMTKQVVPCGAIANSFFDDILNLLKKDGNPVPVLNTGIASPSEKKKFRNPPNSQTNLNEVYKDYVKPPNWRKNIWELDPSNPDNNGLQNEDLIVWITTATLPNFRKLYRRLNRTTEGYNFGLQAGNYTLHVEYNYPVHSFGGRKSFIILTTSFMGGKNRFHGINLIVVCCIGIVVGCIGILLDVIDLLIRFLGINFIVGCCIGILLDVVFDLLIKRYAFLNRSNREMANVTPRSPIQCV
ncbi:cell cycle control protein 50A-like isoform X1 [Daphnia pulicaria]|uniref:cell cycle control protein 50A-like isoform X1 n=1 Tax=Daphnia pulicaria TaxID=35523 RepID=UPI001EEAD2FE|nr:cell cycle control protein 50A-like isoform X1 [Daphnia pulicaria]